MTDPEIGGTELIVMLLPIVTLEIDIACVAGKFRTEMLPVTAPKVVDCDAGKFEMDIAFPIVTDAMLTGIVPEMDAVTEPICAVPATRAGSELIVIEFPIVTEEILIGIVPLMLAVTLPICAVLSTNAGRVVRDTGCVAGKFETEIAENVTA